MNAIAIETSEDVVLSILEKLGAGNIDDALESFAEDFTFKDRGIGLEFKTKERLTEFFYKAKDLYSDSSLRTTTIFENGENVVIEWSLQFTVTQPFYGHLSRELPVSVNGVSIVRITNGKIIEWVDYYDGSTSNRTTLAAHFKDWAEV